MYKYNRTKKVAIHGHYADFIRQSFSDGWMVRLLCTNIKMNKICR